MSHSRYKPIYGPNHSSVLTNQHEMTVAVARAAAITHIVNNSSAAVSADTRHQESESFSQHDRMAVKVETVESKWWYFPTIVAASATSILLAVYLVSISQFGANMLFMFRNLI